MVLGDNHTNQARGGHGHAAAANGVKSCGHRRNCPNHNVRQPAVSPLSICSAHQLCVRTAGRETKRSREPSSPTTTPRVSWSSSRRAQATSRPTACCAQVQSRSLRSWHLPPTTVSGPVLERLSCRWLTSTPCTRVMSGQLRRWRSQSNDRAEPDAAPRPTPTGAQCDSRGARRRTSPRAKPARCRVRRTSSTSATGSLRAAR